MRRELRELQGDAQAKEIYIEGRNKLVASGVFNALRALGRPQRYDFGKDINQMASEASWSSGWNDCLDSLLHFNEYYLPDEEAVAENNQQQAPDFGAIDLAVSRGDLTEEEANARKQQGQFTRPDVTKLTSNIKPVTRQATPKNE